MSGIALVVLIFFILAVGLGAVAYFTYQRKLRRAKAIERGLKMVPILIHLPPPSSDTDIGSRDAREVMREKTAQAEVLYNLISGTATEGFKSNFYGQRHVALELIAIDGVVHFFAAVPVAMVSVVKQALQTAYPGARLEEVEDYNIFNQEGRLAATLGGEMVLRTDSAYPIATYAKLERDPMEALLTNISALDKKDGVAVQIMLRPAKRTWTAKSIKLADGKRKGRGQGVGFSAMDLAKAAVMAPTARREEERARLGGAPDVSNLQLSEIEQIEEKTKHPGFEVLIRVIVSTQSVARSQQLLRDIATSFALFETPGLNGFKFLPALDVQGLVTAFIFRFFPPEIKSNILNSVELATLFHFPDSQFTPTRSVERQQSKQVDGPVQLPASGLLFGHNEFRGIKKEIRLSLEDRRRHTYILGQTGTGKSTMLENLAVQDMLAGNGFAFIDPHGDSAEKLLALVPKERAEDVIYFNPADTEYPLGLNLFEFNDPSQKDFLVQETINMLYKLYDPGKTGIIGPRYEHWYRNAALTLMSDPNGATFIEIPKVFTDTDYLKSKFKYLKDPTVIDFWTKEMGQTSDYHKSEMLGWFVSKFGAFQNNEMMRNIIGQTKSSFNMRDVMDQKKILIVNLSKGRVGELNSQLLGMIFVIKFQAAAMSRADTPESERNDFCMYVDEFQNFSTDSFASILSEARKYRLNLIVANQFIGQLSEEIRNAVFGNIGSIVAHRMGPDDAEFMVKQFAPIFDASDLVNIPNYNAAMRLMIGGLPSQPFTLRDSAPLGQPNLELGLAIKQLSAAKFGHTKAAVEADILDRMTAGSAPAPVPITAVAPAPVVPAVPAAPPGLVAAPAPVSAAPPIVPSAPVPAPEPVAMPVPAPAPMIAAPAYAVTMPAVPASDAMPPAVLSPAQGFEAPVPFTPVPSPASAPPAGVSPVGGATATYVAAVQPVVPVQQEVPVYAPAPPILESRIQQVAPVNSAGQVMSAVEPIIPEGNDEGGFGDLSAPIGVPAVAQDPYPGMAQTPPPIGAPPVQMLPGDAPQMAASPQPMSAVPTPVYAPVPAQSAAVSYAPSQVAFAPVAGAVAPAAAPSASTAPGIMPAPPPIGAPPIDLPMTTPSAASPVMPQPEGLVQEQVQPVPTPVSYITPSALAPTPVVRSSAPSDPKTLSLVDITGGRPPAPRSAYLSSVPLIAPGAEPAQPVSAMQPTISASAVPLTPEEPLVPLGSGMPLEGDPFAGIEVLGDLTPLSQQSENNTDAMQSAAPTPVSGRPLANDPYAGIDITGSERPVAAVPAPAPEAQAQPAAPTPAPIVTSTYAQPEPTTPMAPQAYARPSEPVPAPIQTPPVVPTPAYQPQPIAPVAAPIPAAPMPIAAPISQLASVQIPQPVQVAAPTVVQPVPVPSVAPVAPTVPAQPPMPTSVAPVATQVAAVPPVAEEPEPDPMMGSDEPLIHFVDPAAQAVMDRPDRPDSFTMDNEEELLLRGLPEGVQISKPTPTPVVFAAPPTPDTLAPQSPVPAPVRVPDPAPVPAVVQAPLPVPAPVPIVPPVNVYPTSAAAVPSVQTAATPVPATVNLSGTGEQALANMAKTPPPIGAAPVDLGVVMASPAPVEAEAKVEEPKISIQTPVPETNANLVKALSRVEMPSTPNHLDAPEEKVASVSEMLTQVKADAKPEVQPEKEAPKAQIIDAPQKTAPVPEVAPGPKPEPPSASKQIEKAEQEIDDLLSVSLIRSDSSASHRRLPEPMGPLRSDVEESGVDLELNAGHSPRSNAGAKSDDHGAEHHGLKVIQPLEPIVPPKEQFARELAAMNSAEQVVSAPVPKAVTPVLAPAPVPSVPKVVTPPPAGKVEVKIPPTPDLAATVRHEGEMAPAPEPVQNVAAPVEDYGIPQAESLAANDVARARADREAATAMQKSLPSDAPVSVPAQTPAAAPAPAPAESKQPQKHEEKSNKHKPKREPQPAEHIESAAEAEHNKPTEAEKEQGALTGKLILPTGEKPKAEPVQPKVDKPKKLAPGEVFVDEHGNVVIGE